MSMSPEGRRLFIHDATKPFQPTPRTEVEEMLHKFETAINIVTRETVQPILRAGGYKDKAALRSITLSALLEHFVKFDKMQLENLLAVITADRIFQDCDADRYGTGTKDLMS